MTETNLNIVLSNALCCSSQLATNVAKLYSIGNSCADSEFNKLKLLIDKIEILKCYQFPVTTTVTNVNSQFNIIFTEDAQILLLNTAILGWIINLNINGIKYSITTNGVDTSYNLIINKLTELGIFISSSFNSVGMSLVLACSVIDFNFSIQYDIEAPLINYIFTNTVVGVCPATIITPVENCLTEEQADIMMHDIMRQCDICDCQLTT